MSKPNSDQKEIIKVVREIMTFLEGTRDIDNSQIYQYILNELNTLDEIIPLQRKLALKSYIEEIYLLIKISKENEK
jgi:transcriptional regulator NrdR family protein